MVERDRMLRGRSFGGKSCAAGLGSVTHVPEWNGALASREPFAGRLRDHEAPPYAHPRPQAGPCFDDSTTVRRIAAEKSLRVPLSALHPRCTIRAPNGRPIIFLLPVSYRTRFLELVSLSRSSKGSRLLICGPSCQLLPLPPLSHLTPALISSSLVLRMSSSRQLPMDESYQVSRSRRHSRNYDARMDSQAHPPR